MRCASSTTALRRLAYKEISAAIFSTVGTFGKAVVESKIDRLVRATRYRLIDKDKVAAGSEFWRVGWIGASKSDAYVRFLMLCARADRQQPAPLQPFGDGDAGLVAVAI